MELYRSTVPFPLTATLSRILNFGLPGRLLRSEPPAKAYRIFGDRGSGYCFLIVYFSCPCCATICTASQQEQPVRHPGYFHCRVCAVRVHEWSGLYNFTDWQPVTTKAIRMCTRQRI